MNFKLEFLLTQASTGCSKGLITSATATTGTSKTTATRTSCRSGGASHTLVVDAHGHVGEAQRERGRSTGGEREAHTCWPSLACRPRALVLQAITLDAVTGCV